MGLASQLQQFQQQQGGGPPQGASTQALTGQYPSQQFSGAQPSSQYPQQSFQGGSQYQQNMYGAPQGQSAYPTIQQGWQSGQQSGNQGQGAFPGQQGSYSSAYPGQQGGFQGQTGGAQGQAYQQQPYQQQAYQQQPQQQQPYQQQANQPPTAGQNFQGYITSRLQQMVATNHLQAFYPPQKLQQVVNNVSRVDLRALGQKWNMPMELAFDLCTLALYDIAIYADDSTSMKFAEGGQRIKDLKTILARVTEVATLFDDDGLTVRFMNSNVGGNNLRSSNEASALVDKVKFEGMTPLGTNLDAKIIRPLFTTAVQKQALAKPILVICITDGEPTGEPVEKVVQVIKDAKALATNSPYGGGAIAFEFAQVGKDQAAQAFLAKLDKHRDIGKMIDATSYFELEQEEYRRKGITLTPDVWLVKLMVGAVDPSFDEQD